MTESTVENNPNSLLIRKRLADVLWNNCEKANALEQLNILCDIYPDNGYTLFLNAHYTERSHGVVDALKLYENAAKLDSTTVAIHSALAEAYKTLGQKAKTAKAVQNGE